MARPYSISLIKIDNNVKKVETEFLGVLVDNQLKLKAHIKHIANKMSKSVISETNYLYSGPIILPWKLLEILISSLWHLKELYIIEVSQLYCVAYRLIETNYLYYCHMDMKIDS